MAKNYKRVLAFALVPFVAVNIYAGCKVISKQKKLDSKDLESKYTVSQVDDCVVSSTTLIDDNYLESVNDDISVQTINKDPFKQLLEIYNKNELNYEDILGAYDKNEELYVSALYMKLINSSLSQTDIENQLNNVITMGSVFIDVDEFNWNSLFGKLQSSISEYDNPLDYYYPLAKYVHLAECKLEHKKCYEDEERIYCNEIDKELQIMNDGILLENYVLRELSDSLEPSVIQQVERIYASNLTLRDVFDELDRIYLLAIYPTDFDEETWEKLFSKLLTTVGERDNVCSVYYDLAYYVHMLTCDTDHVMNDYGTYECEPYKLKLDNKLV